MKNRAFKFRTKESFKGLPCVIIQKKDLGLNTVDTGTGTENLHIENLLGPFLN